MFVAHLVLSTVKGIMAKAAIARAEAPISRAFQVVVFIIIVVVMKVLDSKEQRLIFATPEISVTNDDPIMLV